MTDHAPLPPSSADRWVPCPRSATLEPLFPEDEESEAAREGTAAHWYLSESLMGVVGLTVGTLAPNGYPLTAEMIEAITPLVTEIMRVTGGGSVYAGGELRVEQRVAMTSIHPDNWGTPDAYWIDYNTHTIHIWDAKYGHGYVDAFRNWQLVDYGQGVIDTNGLTPGEWSLSLTIYQPRNYHTDGPMRTWRVTPTAHAELVATIRAAAPLARDPTSPAVTGPHCRYCAGRHACEALQRVAMTGVDISRATAPLVLTPAAAGLELRVIAEAEARLKARREGLEAQVSSLVRSGAAGTGWGLEPGNKREIWTQPVADVIAMGAALGVTLAAPPEAITPAQARKAGLDAEVIAAYSTKPKGEMKLVMVTDNAALKAFT